MIEGSGNLQMYSVKPMGESTSRARVTTSVWLSYGKFSYGKFSYGKVPTFHPEPKD